MRAAPLHPKHIVGIALNLLMMYCIVNGLVLHESAFAENVALFLIAWCIFGGFFIALPLALCMLLIKNKALRADMNRRNASIKSTNPLWPRFIDVPFDVVATLLIAGSGHWFVAFLYGLHAMFGALMFAGIEQLDREFAE